MAKVVFDIPDNLVKYAVSKGIYISEWAGHLAQEALLKMENEDASATLSCRPLSRIGFLKGKISVPDDFDTMGQEKIAALFENGA